ncbi:copper resistance D family protein [Streptomyces sp. NPDC003480]
MTVGLATFGGRTGALKRPLAAGWWALVVSTLALLLLRGPYERGSGLEVFSLPETITSQTGMALLGRLVLLAAAAVCIRLPVRGTGRMAGGAALAVTLTLTWTATGHAAAGIQVPMAAVSTVLHLPAMSVWLGGLAALLILLFRAPQDLTVARIARFSRTALTSVAVLVVTGVCQAWRGIGSWQQLTGTSYGRIMVVKLAAVVLLLSVANLSRQWTARWAPAAGQPAEAAVTREPQPVGAHRGDAGEAGSGGVRPAPLESFSGRESSAVDWPAPGQASCRRGLRRTVLAEVALAVAVMAITTVLTDIDEVTVTKTIKIA